MFKLKLVVDNKADDIFSGRDSPETKAVSATVPNSMELGSHLATKRIDIKTFVAVKLKQIPDPSFFNFNETKKNLNDCID